MRRSLAEHNTRIREAIDTIPPAKYEARKEVYIVPLVSPDDRNKNKSSNMVAYIARSMADELPIFKNMPRGGTPTNPWTFNALYPRRQNSLVVFFDDFVGTGDTAADAFAEYRSSIAVPGEDSILVTLVIQEIGLKRLNDDGIEVYYWMKRKRGITDSAVIQDIPKATAVMRALEARIDINPTERFGYGQSEALVAMERTPNNTFPVFWKSHRVDGIPWPAPFPRK
jgi:hypothetical protein